MNALLTLKAAIGIIDKDLDEADLVFGQGADDAAQEASWLCRHCLGHENADEEPDWDQSVTGAEWEAISKLKEERIRSRKPLAYLLNHAWFGGNRFYIDERVIIPRSYLVEWIDEGFEPWIDSRRVGNILDLCTGSGCIGISAALAFDDATVTLADLSTDALEVARLNVDSYNLDQRVRIHQGDAFEGLQERFDLILCNPPYVSDERMERLPREFLDEPAMAFCGGADGLDFISRLLAEAAEYLTDEGTLVVEAGSASHALEDRYADVAFTWLSTAHDEMVVFLITARELYRYRDKLAAFR